MWLAGFEESTTTFVSVLFRFKIRLGVTLVAAVQDALVCCSSASAHSRQLRNSCVLAMTGQHLLQEVSNDEDSDVEMSDEEGVEIGGVPRLYPGQKSCT
jgi:hypothetical protein